MKALSIRKLFFIAVALAVMLTGGGIAYALTVHQLPDTGWSKYDRNFGTWTVTSQSDFQAGVLNNVDVTSSPGDVMIAVPSDWYNMSWECRVPLSISNGGSALADYQLKIDVTYDSDMQSDFDDIRFTSDDAITLLPYWRQSYVDGTSAAFWVRVPSIPAGNSGIYMYYGNSDAVTASDGLETFLFFDDMETWSGWTYYDKGRVSQSSLQAYDGTYSAYKDNRDDPDGAYKSIGATLGRDIILEAWLYRESNHNNQTRNQNRIGVIDDSGNGYDVMYWHGTNHLVGIYGRASYGTLATLSTNNSAADMLNAWYKLSLVIKADGNLSASRMSAYGVEEGFVNGINTTHSSFTRVYIFGGQQGYWVDQMLIRRYASPMPTSVLGAEENPYSIASDVFDAGQAGARCDLVSRDETLPLGTGITFKVRASDTAFDKSELTPTWQDASVIPAVFGQYQQWRATLSTEDGGVTPVLHEVRVLYSW